MRKLTIALAALVAAALLLPATSSAALPNPKTFKIVAGKSLGGIKTKTKVSKAHKIWGNTGDCEITKTSGYCQFAGKSPEDGSAGFNGTKKIQAASITAGFTDSGKIKVTGTMKKFKTSEGIGLGSKAKKVKKAYPKADSLGAGNGYVLKASKSSYMYFVAFEGKISQIVLSASLGG